MTKAHRATPKAQKIDNACGLRGRQGRSAAARTMWYVQPAMQPSAARLEVGSDFADRYRVLSAIKQGGMGSVYEVIDLRTDRLRALKVMLPEIAKDVDLRARFEREASVVGRVRSDHLVEIIDAGICEPDTPFLVMELLRGEELGAILDRGPIAAGEALTFLGQIAHGLDKVHDEGVVHRDLKPENVFVTQRDDGSPQVKILDFGVAKVVDYAGSLRTTRSLGTPLYMAPEQLTGDGTIGPAADLYALAQLAFSMLVGKPYWFEEARDASNAWSFISVVVRGSVEPPSARAPRLGTSLAPGFDRWFAKATDKRPARRFESAREQIEALSTVLGEALGDGSSVMVPRPQATRPSRSRTGWFVVAAGTIGVLTVPLVCSFAKPDGSNDAPPPERTDAAPADRSPSSGPASSDPSAPPAVSASVPALEVPTARSSVSASSSAAGRAPDERSARAATATAASTATATATATASATATATKRDPLDEY